MPVRSPLLRLALSGASLTLSADAHARDTGSSLYTGLRVSYTTGQGVGVGPVVRPSLGLGRKGTDVAVHLGVPVSWTWTFGSNGGQSLDFMAQGGLAKADSYCTVPGLHWYVPNLGGSVQAGGRWTGDGIHPLIGGHVIGTGLGELDYTTDLTEKTHRIGLGGGFPVRLTDCPITDGRPLREADGTACAAEVEVLGDGPVDEAARSWLQRSSDELSAVRAFAELADHLRFHGAPTSLIARAEQAAEEELEHAQMCLAMAARQLGRPVRGRVPRRTNRPPPPLARLAVESLLDGWQNEGEAASAAAQRSLNSQEPQQAAVERRIALEENQHAHFGREIDRWARWQGGRALERRRAELLEQALAGR